MSDTTEAIDNTFIRGDGLFECQACSRTFDPQLPLTLKGYGRLRQWFADEHASCVSRPPSTITVTRVKIENDCATIKLEG